MYRATGIIHAKATGDPGGSIKVEFRDGTDRKIPGRGLDESEAFNGDEAANIIRWHGDPVYLAGQTVKAHFVLNRAKRHAFRFSPDSQ